MKYFHLFGEKMNDEMTIIRQFIKLLETNLRFKGSPKGGGPAKPYQKKEIKPLLGKSEYDDLDELPEEDDEAKGKVKVSKYITKVKEEGEDYDDM